jgi:hypothetical protein
MSPSQRPPRSPQTPSQRPPQKFSWPSAQSQLAVSSRSASFARRPWARPRISKKIFSAIGLATEVGVVGGPRSALGSREQLDSTEVERELAFEKVFGVALDRDSAGRAPPSLGPRRAGWPSPRSVATEIATCDGDFRKFSRAPSTHLRDLETKNSKNGSPALAVGSCVRKRKISEPAPGTRRGATRFLRLAT